jgi:hypothetical protein
LVATNVVVQIPIPELKEPAEDEFESLEYLEVYLNQGVFQAEECQPWEIALSVNYASIV